MNTKTQAELAVELVAVVYQMIAARGSAGIPSGHLYAETMAAFGSLAAYEACIAALVRAKLVRRRGLLLHAV